MNASPRFLLPALLLVAGALHAQNPTITGPALPGMERFDTEVIGLMRRMNSPGAQLAVTRNGRLVLAHGYGFADRDAGELVQPDSLFRIAGLGMPITAVAALSLVDQGKLDLEMKAFPFLGLTPLPGASNLDARLQTITVRQLLHHTGGWDYTLSQDILFVAPTVAAAAGVASPPDVDTFIRYQLGKRLDFDPGTRFVAANIGYMVLGRIIEKITGQSLIDYVQANVFAKAGVTRALQGRSLLTNRLPGEVLYYDFPGAPLYASAFPPSNVLVPGPYGTFPLEAATAPGGWVMTMIDYVRLVGALDGSRPGPLILSPAGINLLTERPAPPVAVGANVYFALGIYAQSLNGATGATADWFSNGSVSGQISSMLRFSNGWTCAVVFNTRADTSVADFSLDISNSMIAAIGATTPPTAGDLFLSSAPQIVTSPVSRNVNAGASATFSAAATSITPATYQWFKDGVAIAGATSTTLSVANATSASAGTITFVATNAAGSTSSDSATLSVGPVISAGHLVNLSILTSLSDSSDSFTLGYVVGGSGTVGAKPLLIRAAGPSLGALGVSGTIADPKLELFAGASKTGENDNWGGAPTLANTMAAVGAFGYVNATSRDAAAVTTITTRDNSVKVSGTGAGTVIAELYDTTPAAGFTATTPRLVNVSVLKPLAAGLSVGFVIGGTTSGKVLIRAIGPTLGAAPFNVPGVVADPQLTLFAGSTKIGENNDWGGTAELSAAFAQVGAFNLGAASKDAVVLVTLAPGNYSVQVSGVANTTGIALVEVYEVP